MKGLNMAFFDKVYEDNYNRTISYWSDRLDQEDPAAILHELMGDLTTLYVRLDNDQEGRGMLGDTTIGAQIAGLEAVRVACVEKINQPVQ